MPAPSILPDDPDPALAYSVLLVPVPELEPVVRPPLQRWAPDYLHADPAAVHAHITLLAPFLPQERLTDEVLSELARLFAGVEPFGFELARLARFPGDGLVHLVPDPTAPFRALTASLWRRWPECPPYGGRFGDVIPHLSLDHADDVEALAPLVAPFVPARVRATAVELYWYEPRRSRSLARFPLAGCP